MYSISVFIQYLTKSKSHWKNMWSDLLLFHLVNPRSSTLSKDKRNIGKIVSILSLQSTEQKQRQNMFIVNLSIQRWKTSMFNYSKNNSFQENSISTFQSPQCQRINPYLNKKQFHVLYLSALVSKPPIVVVWVTSICSYIYILSIGKLSQDHWKQHSVWYPVDVLAMTARRKKAAQKVVNNRN